MDELTRISLLQEKLKDKQLVANRIKQRDYFMEKYSMIPDMRHEYNIYNISDNTLLLQLEQDIYHLQPQKKIRIQA